ncbi:HTH-type transcriptional regulator TtgR [Zhongshania aliphaticivorans]|uniref:HTH-type transcriptional regulator TtgR n=1 Tax=Zhongshania aliphaticivorans TaxID=1470434 RepID=A0A5S9QKF7_9GAMM|nr:TetR/AcrR family transcriptional regulator [Zhongshania aliphaticivorans]CAA0118257.1 HTH-type transcriptional regulator TtgR [Zhongshania aliphaticivorans]CAA0122275.1 HTH-type transcriptional regulator TtgR [Zhongshania aliphaticivorans]
MARDVSGSKKAGPRLTNNTKPLRQTQAERREATQIKVLESACRIFGEKGYADTSLTDIADDLGLTITPIYHYFGNKKSLFLAVTESMEQEFTARLEAFSSNVEKINPINVWDMLIEMTHRQDFVRIVLSDAPIVLGRERWKDTSVVQAVSRIFREQLTLFVKSSGLSTPLSENDIELMQRMLIGCFTEAVLMLAENPDYDSRPLILKTLGLFFSGSTTNKFAS